MSTNYIVIMVPHVDPSPITRLQEIINVDFEGFIPQGGVTIHPNGDLYQAIIKPTKHVVPFKT